MLVKLSTVAICCALSLLGGFELKAADLNARSFGQDCEYAQEMNAGRDLSTQQFNRALACLQFLKGFRAAWVMQAIMVEREGLKPPSPCFPKKQSASEQNNEMIDIIVKYMRDNPLAGNKTIELTVLAAFHEYYPCSSSN